MARGIRLDGDRLRPPREAKTVLVRDGEVLVSDGPFAETKEIICGYDVLECANIAEAVAGGRGASGGRVRQDRGQAVLALSSTG